MLVLPLTIDYKDTNNNHYSKKLNMETRIYSGAEAKKFGIVKGGSGWGVMIVILIVAGGLYGYRRWKKKKKKKK
jgi:hypothetical protein